MKLDEKLTLLEKAQEAVIEAISCLKAATEGDRYLAQTMIAHLEVLVETGGWMSRDTTIPQLIRQAQKETCHRDQCPDCNEDTVLEDEGTGHEWEHCPRCGWTQDLM